LATIFSRIIAGELPARFVWQDERCVAFLANRPLQPGHTLVVPRAEVDHWLDLEPELLAHLAGVAQVLGRALQRGFHPAKVGMMLAGLEVPHVHIHLVPITSERDLDFANQDIFYNVDLFKQKGLALPPKTFDATGWTFSDFLLACQQLTSGAAPNKTYGFAVPTGYRAFLAFVWSNGGDIVTSDASRPAIDQPNAVEGMQFLEDLVGKFQVAPTPAELKAQNANNLFYTGRLGMVTSIPASLSQFRSGVKGFQWDVAPPPLGPHGTKRQVGGGGAGFGVYGQTKFPDQSWQLMQWITGVKVQEQEVDSGTSMGSRLSVGDYFVKVNQGKDPQNVQMFVDASKNSLHTDPHASNWLEVQTILGKELAGIWDASKPAKDATAEAARQMMPLLGQPCAH